MRFSMFSLINVFSVMFAKMSLLFCCFCIRLFVSFRMVLCETSMLLFLFVWCYEKPRCYYSCSYGVMRNLDVIIQCPYGVIRMVLCETSMLLFSIRVSNYVSLNPGLQRARPLWSAASDKLIMHIFSRGKKIYASLSSVEHVEQFASPNLDSDNHESFFLLC